MGDLAALSIIAKYHVCAGLTVAFAQTRYSAYVTTVAVFALHGSRPASMPAIYGRPLRGRLIGSVTRTVFLASVSRFRRLASGHRR